VTGEIPRRRSVMYSEKVVEFFMHPRNVGRLDPADGVGEVGNPRCGDVMKIYIQVRDNRIDDIRFETFGCAAAIATSSMITEMVKGKTLEEALEVSNEDVLDALGGLPPEKIHCSLLAEEGIRAAVEDYRKRRTP
jgi:nitrogen fixation NifU-like protein